MKTKKELYQIVLEELNLLSEFSGICRAIGSAFNHGRITGAEYYFLKRDLKENKPDIFSKFWWNGEYTKGLGITGYWWFRTRKGREQRIKFLEYLIKNA